MHTGVLVPMTGTGGSPAHLANGEMSSIAQTQPPTGRRNFNLRAYLAGTAATAALLGAVVLVFASLGAYVAFNGLPIGGSSDTGTDTTSVSVGRAATGVTAKSHEIQDGATANVHGSQGSRSSGGSSGGTSADAPGASTIPTEPSGPIAGQPTVTATGAQETVTSATVQTPSGGAASTPIPTPQVTAPDSVGGTVGTVEQTLHDADVDVPLGGAGTAVDQTAGDLLGGN
jgi:hypothetical protein